tara:strand:+ start:341 stop:658 length:318 start_codon:yes stop_codon:yes gene_type:complete
MKLQNSLTTKEENYYNMSRKAIRIAGEDLVEEKSYSFAKQEDGTFKRITKTQSRNIKNNSIKEKAETISEESYKIVTDDDYAYTMSYQDYDGEEVSVRFKKIDTK